MNLQEALEEREKHAAKMVIPDVNALRDVMRMHQAATHGEVMRGKKVKRCIVVVDEVGTWSMITSPQTRWEFAGLERKTLDDLAFPVEIRGLSY